VQFKFTSKRIDVRTKPIIESIRSVRVPRVSKFVVVELGGSFIADQTDCMYIRYVTVRYDTVRYVTVHRSVNFSHGSCADQYDQRSGTCTGPRA
jgi:hypothetical protein